MRVDLQDGSGPEIRREKGIPPPPLDKTREKTLQKCEFGIASGYLRNGYRKPKFRKTHSNKNSNPAGRGLCAPGPSRGRRLKKMYSFPPRWNRDSNQAIYINRRSGGVFPEKKQPTSKIGPIQSLNSAVSPGASNIFRSVSLYANLPNFNHFIRKSVLIIQYSSL